MVDFFGRSQSERERVSEIDVYRVDYSFKITIVISVSFDRQIFCVRLE